MDFKKKILLEIIEQSVLKNNCFLIDVVFRGTQNNPVVEIFVDNEQGVTTELCSMISRDLSTVIEDQELLSPNYRVDISSPGVDRPLKYIDQFKKHINRKFEVVYQIEESKNKIEGTLRKINNDKLLFESGNSQIEIDFNSVKSAKVLISF